MIDKAQLQQQIAAAAREVRGTNPMAGSITNTVTINFVANAQIAVGGSAAMVYLPDEGEFLAGAGGATYINVGTLFPIYKETLPRTARTLHEAGKPWVLDPVAIGIGEMRTDLLAQFKEFKPTIIRGNASEVIALANLWELEGDGGASQVRGVDSTQAVDEARAAAVALGDGFGHRRRGRVLLLRRIAFHGEDHRVGLQLGRRVRRVCRLRRDAAGSCDGGRAGVQPGGFACRGEGRRARQLPGRLHR